MRARRIKRFAIVLAVPGLLLLGACGFESVMGLATASDHPVPDGGTNVEPKPAIVTGSVPAASLPSLDPRDLVFLAGDGTPLSPSISIDGENFTAGFPAGARYSGMVVAVRRGTTALRDLVPLAEPGETVSAGDFDGIDNRETAACLLIEAKASMAGRTPGSYPADTLSQALLDIDGLSSSGDVAAFYAMVQAIVACSDCVRGTAARFRSPVLTSSGLAIESALHPDFILANPIDYDNDGNAEDTTEKFDAALAAAASAFAFKACYCDEQDYFAACGYTQPMLQVVIAADMNAGSMDGNCDAIDRFLWAEDSAGAGMFIAAGIHPDSPIQDNAIEQELGAWVPNSVPMYDDGTHADERAGDGIWTASFVLPVGLRIGYKFTWGRQGENWGGTEEWPGNRRLLEIVDVNDDHIVARRDNFADETSNKDIMNRLLPANGGNGTVTWDTDANGDGVPDARERMIDSDGDCTLDSWWTPANAQPLTTACQ
jgi:hypothetical protein